MPSALIVAIFLGQLASTYKESLALSSTFTDHFTAAVLENCPSKCECQRIGRGLISGIDSKQKENKSSSEEEEEYSQFVGLSVRCLRGSMNDSEFLSLLQNVPVDVEQLEIRGAPGKPNKLHWSDNLNRLSRLRHLALVNCSMPALSQSIRLPLLSQLYLMGNELEQIQLGSFVGMPMLEMLDLSSNRISALSTGAFIYLKNLHSLRLSHNRLGGPDLSTGNLLRGPRHLKELQLDGNKLNAKQLNELLPDVSLLERLELNNCGLNDAELWALNLSAVPRLRRIGLGSNNLTQVPSASLRALASLETLDLRENLIRSVGPCAFCGMNITKVFLGGNLLGLTSGRPFNREAFSDTQIEELDLGWNHFRQFDSSILSGAQATLETLHLSGNQIEMNGHLIGTLPRLKELHLADCSLNNIPYSLSKSYQKLNKLPHLLVDFVDHLQLVYLHHNPWDCECAAQTLQLHMLQRLSLQEQLRFDETLCAVPQLLKGQPLHRVQKINDCAVIFGSNFGITQNTELVLILSALLIAAFFLSLILILLLYWGRDAKQKGSYITNEKNETTKSLPNDTSKMTLNSGLSPLECAIKDLDNSPSSTIERQIPQSTSRSQISIPQPLPPTNLLRISPLINQQQLSTFDQQQQPLLIQNTFKEDNLNNNYFNNCAAPKEKIYEDKYKSFGKRIAQEEERRTMLTF
uniref:LRRCT domain-containing protein n=1 Tax=Meloidogyne hapla TaxID=6305 RepID=A0A1I8BEG0_MELHA